MFDVSVVSALIGGVLTFFAPCTLPILPAFISYLLGSRGEHHSKLHALLTALGFSLGFSLVFFVFGVISGELGTTLSLHRGALAKAGGVVVILFGLSLAGLLKLPRILPSGSLHSLATRYRGPASSFVLGSLFAIGWSPCLGPVLGTILILAAGSGGAAQGGLLLLTYALGFTIPFMLLALFIESLRSQLLFLSQHGATINLFSGILLVLLGVFLVFGNYGQLMSIFGGMIDITTYDWVMQRM